MIYIIKHIKFSIKVYTVELSRIGISAGGGGGDAYYSPNNFYYENLQSFLVLNPSSYSSSQSAPSLRLLNQTDENNLVLFEKNIYIL